MYAPNPAMLRLKLECEGYRVYQWGDAPGAIFPTYKHPKLQSHWVVSGSLEFTVSGEIYTLEAGDRSFLDAETYQSMRVVSEDFAIYLVGEKNKLLNLIVKRARINFSPFFYENLLRRW